MIFRIGNWRAPILILSAAVIIRRQMACGANYAWANRQLLMHQTQEIFEKSLHLTPRELGMRLVYDVCHNIAKIETFNIQGKMKKLCVHRKGATRAFPAGHDAVPQQYKSVGQPVLIPGDMGSGSYVLVGQQKAMQETFGSACHGAGRVMSRTQATKVSQGRSISRELADQGVLVMAASLGTLREEIPEAYKNVNDVVQVMHEVGLQRKWQTKNRWPASKDTSILPKPPQLYNTLVPPHFPSLKRKIKKEKRLTISL